MHISRRQFLQNTALLTAGIMAGCSSPKPPRRKLSANDKLNLGVIGVANRGGANLDGVSGENIMALCDVDSTFLAAASAKFPKAATMSDFRRLIDRTDLDGIVVSTPDHNHAIIAIAAMQSGRPVYCEKPLTHKVSEMRRMLAVAKKTGVVTQTGNQIHASENYRRVVEKIQAGVIGPVHEVHHWVGGTSELKPLPSGEPVPATLDYDQWVGPVTWMPYSKEWVPFKWRSWWHFGGGTLSDFCCHHVDLSAWALELTLPTVIEAEGPKPDAYCVPTGMRVRYEFPARGFRRAVTMYWHSGAGRPQLEGLPDLAKWGGGTLFVGQRGMLLSDYGRHLVLPEEKFKDMPMPAETLAESVGHHQEWIRAVKGENLALPQFAALGRTNSPFAYGGLLTEIGQLGNIAFRTGKRIEWDAERMRAKGVPEADKFIHHEYRKGWKLG